MCYNLVLCFKKNKSFSETYFLSDSSGMCNPFGELACNDPLNMSWAPSSAVHLACGAVMLNACKTSACSRFCHYSHRSDSAFSWQMVPCDFEVSHDSVADAAEMFPNHFIPPFALHLFNSSEAQKTSESRCKFGKLHTSCQFCSTSHNAVCSKALERIPRTRSAIKHVSSQLLPRNKSGCFVDTVLK